MVTPDKKNLFVGPRPISAEEKIFGRNDEIRRLTHLFLAERIVLLHSPSGAGKSSLIAAGFLPELADETDNDFYVLPTVRLSLSSTAVPSSSPFSRAVVRSWDQTLTNGSASASIEQYVEEHAVKEAGGRCICIVFDQFEECLSFLPGQDTAKSALFADLERTLANSNVWALFAVREDMLAPILDLGQILPTAFKQTFRLDFLSKENAQEVIRETAQLGGYQFENEALDRLVTDLATINVQNPDGTFTSQAGEYVEPLHLQVACKHILETLPSGTTTITETVVARKGEEGPRPETSVNEALAAYYRSELHQIVGNDKAIEQDVRFWIQENLIDIRGIRTPIRQEATTTKGLDNRLIESLYGAYLVRKERRLNATYYELAHDRLIQPVLRENKDWFDQNLGIIGKQCREYVKSGCDPRHLLDGRDLKEAARQVREKKAKFSQAELDFVERSKRRRRAAKLRFWVPLTSCLVAVLLFGALAWYLHRTTTDLEYYKFFTVLRPLYSASTAGSADRNILFGCHLLKELRARKAVIDPLLFGDVVTILDRTMDRRRRLVTTYWNYSRPSAPLVGNPIEIGAVAYSADGQTLAIGDGIGRFRVLRHGALSDPIKLVGWTIWTMAFSPDGLQVATGNKSGFVSICYVGDASPAPAPVRLVFPGDPSEVPEVWSCSWNENGDLAAGCQDGRIYIWEGLRNAFQATNLRPSRVLENRLADTPIPVHAVAWNHNGSVLATGDARGRLCLWNRDGSSSKPIAAHSEAIWSVAWSGDGRIACGSWDHSISIWSTDETSPGSEPIFVNRKESAHDQWVRDVAWINHEQAIASVGDDGMLKFWKSPELTELGSEQNPTTNVWKLSVSAADNTIATANNDGTIRIFQFSPPPRQKMYGHTVDAIIRLRAADSSVLSFDSEGNVDRLDLASGKDDKVQIPSEFQSGIQSVGFQSQTNACLIGYDFSYQHKQFEGEIAFWNPDLSSRPTFCLLKEPVRSVDCAPANPVVAFATQLGTLGFRHLPDLTPIADNPDVAVLPNSGAASPPVGAPKPNADTQAILKDAKMGRLVWSHRGDALLVAVNRLAGDVNKSEILQFRVGDGPCKYINAFQIPASIYSMALSPGDDIVAIGTTGGAVILQSMSGAPTPAIVAHDGPVTTVAWATDGRHLFTGGSDGSVKAWSYDAKANRLALIITLRHDTGGVYTICVPPEGDGFYSAGDNGHVIFWPQARYSVDAILDRARKMVNRNMLGTEWKRYAESKQGSPSYEKTFGDLPDLSQSKAQ
jgi:WD40 repeat protein